MKSMRLMTTPNDIPFKSKADDSTQHYVEILPKGYNPEKQYNLLIAFHGHGSDRWQYIRDARDECRAVREVASEHGMILLSPDYRAKASWMGPLAEADTLQIIEEQCQQRKIDKVILVGASMGGARC